MLQVVDPNHATVDGEHLGCEGVAAEKRALRRAGAVGHKFNAHNHEGGGAVARLKYSHAALGKVIEVRGGHEHSELTKHGHVVAQE